MKIFSDDDLVRLKDGLAGPDDAWFDGYSVKTIKALLARLEAAELALNGSTHIEIDYPESKCEGCKNIEAWRKAAGK